MKKVAFFDTKQYDREWFDKLDILKKSLILRTLTWRQDATAL